MVGPDVRASDGEREQALVRLRDAAAEGRLTFEELADRIDVAGRAVTRAELERVTGDLPESGGAPAAMVVAPVRHSSVFGDVRRDGAWVVPAESRWSSFFGDVVLDLRQAQVGAPEVAIEARSVFGDIDLLVPEGVLVEVRCRTIFGDLRQHAGGMAGPGAPRIVVTGGTVFGDVKVRAQRVRERVADWLRSAAT